MNMNKTTNYLTVLAIVTLFTFTGCKKAIQEAVDNSINTYLNNTLQSGYWTIIRYTEGTKDSTAIFNNWKTYFNDGSQLLSLYDASGVFKDSTKGSWSNSTDMLHFTCTYPTGTKYPLNKISDYWSIASYSSGTTAASKTVTFARTTYGHPDTLKMQNHP